MSRRLLPFTVYVVLVAAFAVSLQAQSTDQSFPSPVMTSELTGTINARDIGDARVTTYYYIFDAGQGDLFINFLTKNFTGDVDIFIQDGLRPLSKIVMYADLAETETGRVLYFRKPERLLMRVQGRTPGDEAATFRIKFAGSFQAIADGKLPEPELPTVTSTTETNVRVNSVGTILEVIPKAVPVKVEEKAEDVAQAENKEESPAVDQPVPKAVEPAKKVEVVVSDNTPAPKAGEESVPTLLGRRRRGSSSAPKTTVERSTAKAPPRVRRTAPPKAVEPPKEPAPDPLANVQLVIEFKDGRTIKRPMTEVFRFTFDRGQLTVISKDGSIGRYPMLDVASVTIK